MSENELRDHIVEYFKILKQPCADKAKEMEKQALILELRQMRQSPKPPSESLYHFLQNSGMLAVHEDCFLYHSIGWKEYRPNLLRKFGRIRGPILAYASASGIFEV